MHSNFAENTSVYNTMYMYSIAIQVYKSHPQTVLILYLSVFYAHCEPLYIPIAKCLSRDRGLSMPLH